MFRMNFVRSKRDEHAMQSLMREEAFSLRVRNELLALARTDVDLNSTVAPDAMSRSFGVAASFTTPSVNIGATQIPMPWEDPRTKRLATPRKKKEGPSAGGQLGPPLQKPRETPGTFCWFFR